MITISDDDLSVLLTILKGDKPMMEKHGVDKRSEKDEMEKRSYVTEAQRRRHEQFKKASKGKYQKRMEQKYGKKEGK